MRTNRSVGIFRTQKKKKRERESMYASTRGHPEHASEQKLRIREFCEQKFSNMARKRGLVYSHSFLDMSSC